MMRKVFVGLLVGAVTVALAAPAFAADLKFTGAYRLRFQADNSLPCFDATPGAECDGHTFQSRFRPRFEVETEGGVKGVIFLEIGDLTFGNNATVGKGATGGAGNDGVNIETKHAYIEFPIPATPFRLRGGQMGYNTNKDLLLSDDGSGITIWGKVGAVDVKAWWMRANEASSVGPEGQLANDLFALDLSGSPWKDLTLTGYVIYNHDGESRVGAAGDLESATGIWLGVGAAGKVEALRWDLDFIYGSKEINVSGSKEDKEGFVIDGGVGMALPGTPIDLEVRAWYATGDERDGGDNEGFPTLAATGLTSPTPDHNTGAQIWGNGGAVDIDELADSPENTWGVGLIVRYTVSPAFKLSGNIHYIGTNEEGTAASPSPAGNGVISGVDSIGTEVGVRMDYTLYRGLTLTVLLSHLFLGDDTSENNITKFDDITKYAGVLNYAF
jgi:hypothetical protein